MGPCRGAKDRYHYDSATGDCKQFTFGGCRGNKNNFQTIEECRTQCKKGFLATPATLKSPARIAEARQSQSQEDPTLKCVLPADPGISRQANFTIFNVITVINSKQDSVADTHSDISMIA